MLLGQPCGWFAFKHLLDQINTPTRPVQFIALQLISRAGRIAKAAMYTGAYNRLQFTTQRFFDIIVEMESASDLARFEIISHLTNGLALNGQQPTVGLWMNRSSAQYVMHQGPPSATRVASSDLRENSLFGT